MSKKTRILAVIMTVLVLAGSLVLVSSADEVKESREDLPELERISSERTTENNNEDPLRYEFLLKDNSCTTPFGDEYYPSTIDILFNGGGYIRVYGEEEEEEEKRSVSTFDVFVPLNVYWDYFLRERNVVVALDVTNLNYSVKDDTLFLLDENLYLYFSLTYIYLIDVGNNSSYVLADHLVFRCDDGNDNYVYFGCSGDDFDRQIAIEDIHEYARNMAPKTFVDWFFDTAFPVFGSVDDNIIDLGILGNYKPIQLYKFLFSLALVVAAIVLLVWLPMYGLFRLLRIKRKKR